MKNMNNMKNMDVSSLREQYRNSRDSQRKHTQVLLFNAVSEELSDPVSIVPVTQGLTSSPPNITFVVPPDPATFDPWHIHLDHHRRSCSGVTVPLPPTCFPCTHISVSCSSRPSSSSSSSSSSESTDELSDSLSSCRETSPCSAPCSIREEEHRPGTEAVCGSEVAPVSASLDSTEQNPRVRSTESHALGALTCTDVARVACSSPCSSTSALHDDQKNQSTVLQTRTSSSSRLMKIIRQQSVGAESSSSLVHLNQNQSYYPFPSRKTQKISETARKLGMYSSF